MALRPVENGVMMLVGLHEGALAATVLKPRSMVLLHPPS
jgi:hypothetical protein